MNKRFSIDPEIDPNTQRFFKRLIYILIVLNVILGSITIYDRYIYEHTPNIQRDISTITTNEV